MRILAFLLGLGTLMAFIIGGYFIFVLVPNMTDQYKATSDLPLLWMVFGGLFISAGLGLASMAIKILDDNDRRNL